MLDAGFGVGGKAVRIVEPVDVERDPAPCRGLERHCITVQGAIAQSPAATSVDVGQDGPTHDAHVWVASHPRQQIGHIREARRRLLVNQEQGAGCEADHPPAGLDPLGQHAVA